MWISPAGYLTVGVMVEIFAADSLISQREKAKNLPETSALLHADSMPLKMNGVGGTVARVAGTTLDGLAHTPQGLVNAVDYNIKHPIQALETVGVSAAFAATLKVVLPEAGPVGKVAGLAMGAWFLAGTAPSFVDAYKTGLNAKTWAEFDRSGEQWGNAAGHLGVNSALGWVGYKIGGGMADNILARERFDNFADIKQNFWDSATDKTKRLFGFDSVIPTAAETQLRPSYQIEGDRAILTDSVKPGAEPVGSGEATPAPEQAVPAIDPNVQMDATVMLRSRATVLRMDRYLARMSRGEAPALTDANNAFLDKFGAKPESLDALNEFARKNQLKVTESDLRSGRVVIEGKSGDFQKAFGVEIKDFGKDGKMELGHTGVVSIPKDLAPHVRAVLGIDQAPVVTSSYRYQISEAPPEFNIQAQTINPGDNASNIHTVEHGSDPAKFISPESLDAHNKFVKTGGYLASDIAKAQNIDMSTGGAGQRGVFISASGGIDLADYNKFFPEHGIEQPKPLGIIEIGSAKNSPGVPHAGDIENTLDALQMQTVAPKAQVDMIIGRNDNRGFADAFERAIFPRHGEQDASVISTSWGLAEATQTTEFRKTMTIAFREAAIRGIQVFAAAGDYGAKGNTTIFQPEYPASDPNVTGVGGLKMVLNNDGSLRSVAAWNEGSMSATGGGVSNLYRLPKWQENANVPMNLDTNKPGRGVPDISTNAATNTGYPVRIQGSDIVIGGTSAGAPLYAGMMLNINAELALHGIKPITPLNPWLYARANSGIFNDVSTGNNNGYETRNGWDAVTGLGWVNGKNMLSEMLANQTTVFPRTAFLAGLNNMSGTSQIYPNDSQTLH